MLCCNNKNRNIIIIIIIITITITTTITTIIIVIIITIIIIIIITTKIQFVTYKLTIIQFVSLMHLVNVTISPQKSNIRNLNF